MDGGGATYLLPREAVAGSARHIALWSSRRSRVSLRGRSECHLMAPGRLRGLREALKATTVTIATPRPAITTSRIRVCLCPHSSGGSRAPQRADLQPEPAAQVWRLPVD